MESVPLVHQSVSIVAVGDDLDPDMVHPLVGIDVKVVAGLATAVSGIPD